MREVFKGATSNTEYFMLVDSTTGLGKTGLVYTDMTGSYTRSGAARTAITMATLASASAAYSSGGFIEVDATNCPGLYRLDVPDAAYATGVVQVIVSLKATGVKTEHLRIILSSWNQQVAAIPNVAAGANGGLPTGNASGQVVVASTATGAITAASFAAGAIDNAAIAADAIGSSELAASAVTEIQSGLATSANQTTILANQATIAAYIDTEVAAIKAKTDNLPASPAATGDIPTAAAIADAVWDEATSGHVTSGTTGAALVAAGGAGDPWSTSLPGAYGAGTAGYIIGVNIDAAISAVKTKTDNLPADPADASDIASSFSTVNSTLSTIAGYLDTEVAAIKAKTDNLPASPAATSDIPTATENADALLNRDMSAVSDTNSRSPLNALRALRNKTDLALGKVYKENDTTQAWAFTVTTDAAADPVTVIDPS